MENAVKNVERNTLERLYTVSVYKGDKKPYNKKFNSHKKAYEYAERRYMEVEVTNVTINFTCTENEMWTK